MRLFLKISGIILFVFILMLVGVSIYLQTETGQAFLTKKVVGYLKTKIETPFNIQKIKYSIPDWIELEGVYFADKKGDTLLVGQKLYVNLDMLGLLQNKVDINEVNLENIRLNIKRTLPDTTFNFAYIINYFTPKNSPQAVVDTAKGVPLGYKIAKIILKNVSVNYLDDISGIDAKGKIVDFNTSFSAFDPSVSQYHLNKLNLDGGNFSLRLFQPIKNGTSSKKADPLDLAFNELDAKNISWKFLDETAGMMNSAKLGQLYIEGDQLQIEDQKVHFKSFELTKSDIDFAVLKKKAGVQKIIPPVAVPPNNWKVVVDKMILEKNNIQYHDQNALSKSQGIDYNNINISALNLFLKRIQYSDSQISGLIQSGSFKEKSGLELQKLQTDFSYTDKQIYFKKLLIKTPQTELKDELVFQYKSIDEWNKNLGNINLKTSLKNSQIAFKDLLLLFPEYAQSAPFKGNENAILKINGLVSGKINNLKIAQTTINGFDKAKINIEGQILGLPNIKNTILNLNVKELSITKNDFLKVLPKGTIPNTMELPENVSLVGKVNGKLNNLLVDTKIKSSMGNAAFKGKLINITADKNQQYDGLIILDKFDVGKLLKQSDQIGKITVSGKIKGNGFDTKTLNASFDGIIQQADFNGYNYKNVDLKAEIAKQIAIIKGNISDPNITLTIDSKFDITKEFPGVKGNVIIDKLNLQALGIYSKNIAISGNIDVDMPVTDPKNPSGTITINSGTLFQNGKPIKIENMVVSASNSEEGKKILINAPFIKAKLTGDFNYLQIPDIFINTLNRYFVLPDITIKPIVEPYSLAMDVKLVNHPAIQSFFPLLTRLDTARFVANIDTKADTLFRANLMMPIIEYDTINASNVKLKLVADHRNLSYTSSVDAVKFTSFQVRKTSLTGTISNNIILFKALFKDVENKDRNEVAGRLQSVDGQYRINLNKSGLKLNYVPWQVDSTGFIQYGKAGLLVNNFNINRGIQKLNINSTSLTPDGPISIKTDSLEIQNFVNLFSSDSTMASGKIDGEILLSNYWSQPLFKGDFAVKNFYFKQAAIGDLNVNIYNESANVITTKATLINQNNNISLTGSYFLNTKDNLDLSLIINKLSAQTLEAFSFGALRRSKGNLIGQADIKGSLTNPQINGKLGFEKVAFDLTAFGGRYLIDNQNLVFKNQTVFLNQFIISDTLKQPLKVNGTVLLTDIPNVKYDLTIDAQNFLALNSTRKDNDFIYGKGIVDADLTLKGVSTKAKIEGDIKIRENSKITVIIPNDDDLVEETEGVVIFVNRKNPELNYAQQDTLSDKPFVNDFINEISLNIDADEKSELTLVVDEINGDNLKVKGNGKLNAGINNYGKPYILGSYDLTEGSYGITFEVIKKAFIIQKGSSIIWSGDPMNGDVNITAVYKVNTAPLDLMVNEISSNSDVYRQKMNFEILLTMSGKLSRPNISFKIQPSETQRFVPNDVITSVKARLAVLDAEEVNKQVFALLVLNRFFSEKSSDFFSNNNGGNNAAAFARQSVSKLLTDQLNQFTSGFIKGVGLDVNLSSTQDYFNGISSSRTDLNLGLSKAFFNDKIEVKVGRNFELENNTKITRNPNEVFDNIMVNYKLSRDGKFLFKAFRKNQFQSVLEGFIVETGVGFSIAKDYGKIRELFMRRKKENE